MITMVGDDWQAYFIIIMMTLGVMLAMLTKDSSNLHFAVEQILLLRQPVSHTEVPMHM